MMLKFHKFANLFPLMTEEEQVGLQEDIQRNGQRDPIIIIGDEIIDGRNRYNACLKLGIKPVIEKWQGGTSEDELLAFVISKNTHRRHLTVGQRAMIAANIANMTHGGNRKDQELNSAFDISQEKAATIMNIGVASVKVAKTILNASPSVSEEVFSGKISLNAGINQINNERMAKWREEEKVSDREEKIEEVKEFDWYKIDSIVDNLSEQVKLDFREKRITEKEAQLIRSFIARAMDSMVKGRRSTQ